MFKEKFIQKFRKKLGCKGEAKICWCKTCCTLEQIYEYMFQAIHERIK